MRHNVTTPGGFFVGLGGIVAFCVVSSAVYLWVKSPAANAELLPQQVALGLAAGPDVKGADREKKEAEVAELIKAAGQKYEEKGRMPDINNLSDLRGVVRYREARKIAELHAQTLSAPSNVPGKTVIEAAMEAVATEMAAKKPAASQAALMEMVPDPKSPPVLPNYGGGGSRTVNFADPAKPATPAPAPASNPPAATPPASATPAAPAPATPPAAPATPPAAPATPPVTVPPSAPAPSRPPLINSSQPK